MPTKTEGSITKAEIDEHIRKGKEKPNNFFKRKKPVKYENYYRQWEYVITLDNEVKSKEQEIVRLSNGTEISRLKGEVGALGNTNYGQKLEIDTLTSDLKKSKTRYDLLELAREGLERENQALKDRNGQLKLMNEILSRGRDSGYAEDDDESIDSYFSDRKGTRNKQTPEREREREQQFQPYSHYP